MKTPRTAQRAFDPFLERLVPEIDTSSDRIRAKLSNHYNWCFCELCWRPTEYSALLEAPMVIKRLQRGNAKIVPITDAMRAAAQKRTDVLVERYERACTGEFGPYEAGRMWSAYCDAIEMRGDRSVAGFREHVERKMLITEWAKHGELVWLTKPSHHPEGAAKPSKLYCEAHNPRRSADARRAYQRDRRFLAEYEQLIEIVRSQGIRTATLPLWDIEAHAFVRKEAYRQLQILKSPTRLVESLLADGTKSQAEIARQLGISRQAVSAAVRRRAQKRALD